MAGEAIGGLASARPFNDGGEPALWTLSEAAAAIEAGSICVEDLARSVLERISQLESEIKAFSFLDPGLVIRRAREIDKSPRTGELRGVLIGVKDMIDTRDMPTQHNSPIYVDHRPSKDAAVVATVRARQAVLIGKTDTHEFAAGGRLPASRNPHNTAHTPGGSSSGSGASVAAGFAGTAFGTQTAGSMLRPASFCGIFGFKPTHAVVSQEGAKLYSVTLDTIGWYGRSVSDLAMMASALRAVRKKPVPRPGLKGARIGLCRTPWWDQASAEAQQALERAATLISDAGAAVEEFDLPEGFERLVDVQNTIMRGEGRAAFLNDYLESHELLSQDFRDRVEDKDAISFDKLRDALDFAAACRPRLDQALQGFDALVTVGAIGEAPRSLATTGNPLFQRAWTTLHVPCAALPCFTGPNGMPIGVQLVAARYRDCHLIEIAAPIAEALGVPRVRAGAAGRGGVLTCRGDRRRPPQWRPFQG